MTDLDRALLHIKNRADAWAVKEVEKALSQKYWIDKDNKLYKMPDDIPQKSGTWILTDDDFVYCSECEDSYYPRPIDASWYYCPHCGAKMESNNNE